MQLARWADKNALCFCTVACRKILRKENTQVLPSCDEGRDPRIFGPRFRKHTHRSMTTSTIITTDNRYHKNEKNDNKHHDDDGECGIYDEQQPKHHGNDDDDAKGQPREEHDPQPEGLSSSFWDGRHPSLGLPVGCLVVPRECMNVVQSTLAGLQQAKRRRGGPRWLRRNGTIPRRRNSSSDATGGEPPSSFEIHLTTLGATQIEKWFYYRRRCKEEEENTGNNKTALAADEAEAMIPRPIQDLLRDGVIQWEPGVRFLLPKKNKNNVSETKDVLAPKPKHNILAPKSCSFRFAELFAGIGGFRLGLEELNGECVFSSEIDSFASDTYELNFGHRPTVGDITTVDFVSSNNDSNDTIPPNTYELLVGGFPCQSFSHSGRQGGLASSSSSSTTKHNSDAENHNEENYDEDNNNGRLYLEVCRVLCATAPRAFLLENVANLYTMDGGTYHEDAAKRRPGKTYKTIIRDLRRCGYTVQTKTINAGSFGVPQHRERLFFVGFSNPQNAKAFRWPTAAANTNTTVGSILEPEDSEAVEAAVLTRDQYDRVGHFLNLDETDRLSRRARLGGIARTLMSSYKSGQLKHYKEFVVVGDDNADDSNDNTEKEGRARFYTAREAARIMGFPDSYVIPGSACCAKNNSSAYGSHQRFYRQIGNAVCPPVVRAIAECVLVALEESEKENGNDP